MKLDELMHGALRFRRLRAGRFLVGGARPDQHQPIEEIMTRSPWRPTVVPAPPANWATDAPTLRARRCNRAQGLHVLYVHADNLDRCFCGASARPCEGIEVCQLDDYSWLPCKPPIDLPITTE